VELELDTQRPQTKVAVVEVAVSSVVAVDTATHHSLMVVVVVDPVTSTQHE